MKSKVISYPDFKTYEISPELLQVPYSDPEERIAEEFSRLQKKHASYAELTAADALAQDDNVVINASCTAADAPAKFNRDKVQLKLGKKLYNPIVENALIGHKIGETVTVDVNGLPVNVSIVSAKRLAEHPLTQDELDQENLPGQPSLEAYRQQLKDELHFMEGALHLFDHVLPDLRDWLIAGATFDIDEQERAELIQLWIDETNKSLEEEGGTDLLAAKREMLGMPNASEEELNKRIVDSYQKEFLYGLILLDIAEKNQLEAPTEEAYNAAIVEHIDALGMSEEAFREFYPYHKYAEDNLRQAANDLIMQALQSKLPA